MPHSLFLGSALATQDRISFRGPQDAEGTPDTVSEKERDDDSLPVQNHPYEKVSYLRRLYGTFKKVILDAFLKPPANLYGYGERQKNSFEFVRAHIYYGMFDMVGSLLGFAVMINSLYVFPHFFLFFFLSVSFVYLYMDYGLIFIYLGF